jgi:hypothetical protein
MSFPFGKPDPEHDEILMQKLFTNDHTWSGGFYEIVFRLDESEDPQQALSSLWSHPQLEGCYSDRNREPGQQEKVSPVGSGDQHHWYGLATLPSQEQCAAGSLWTHFENTGTWLTFYIPLGSLGKAYPIGAFPFSGPSTHSPKSWMLDVNDWLKGIAEGIFPRLQFSLALIGFEVEYLQVLEQLRSGIPAERWEGILVVEEGQLTWYPPTLYDPPIII